MVVKGVNKRRVFIEGTLSFRLEDLMIGKLKSISCCLVCARIVKIPNVNEEIGLQILHLIVTI